MHKILNEEHTLDYLCGTNTELPEEDGVQLTQVQKMIICTFMLSKILTLPSNFDSFVTFYLWKMMQMYLQKVKSKKNLQKKK